MDEARGLPLFNQLLIEDHPNTQHGETGITFAHLGTRNGAVTLD
jgi:hypothetical protein